MPVNYNDFSKTFSNSRKTMKWEEIDYFLDFLLKNKNNNLSLLDVGCGNGRLLNQIEKSWLKIDNYLWIDLSSWLVEEAKTLNPNYNFEVLDMLSISKIKNKFDSIFFIASFHHLKTLSERLEILKQTKNILKPAWVVFMTNWALDNNLNKEKYKNSVIQNSKNEFWSLDYSIKIGKFTRYYHSFSVEELQYLFEETWFHIIENKLFSNDKNYISIVSI